MKSRLSKSIPAFTARGCLASCLATEIYHLFHSLCASGWLQQAASPNSASFPAVSELFGSQVLCWCRVVLANTEITMPAQNPLSWNAVSEEHLPLGKTSSRSNTTEFVVLKGHSTDLLRKNRYPLAKALIVPRIQRMKSEWTWSM